MLHVLCRGERLVCKTAQRVHTSVHTSTPGDTEVAKALEIAATAQTIAAELTMHARELGQQLAQERTVNIAYVEEVAALKRIAGPASPRQVFGALP